MHIAHTHEHSPPFPNSQSNLLRAANGTPNRLRRPKIPSPIQPRCRRSNPLSLSTLASGRAQPSFFFAPRHSSLAVALRRRKRESSFLGLCGGRSRLVGVHSRRRGHFLRAALPRSFVPFCAAAHKKAAKGAKGLPPGQICVRGGGKAQGDRESEGARRQGDPRQGEANGGECFSPPFQCVVQRLRWERRSAPTEEWTQPVHSAATASSFPIRMTHSLLLRDHPDHPLSPC